MPQDKLAPAPSRAFLAATWSHVAVLSYTVEPHALRPLIPSGTELDDFHGHALVSVVAMLVSDLRVAGLPVPGGRAFEHVSLRIPVVREARGERRAGVVITHEIVPRAPLAWAARQASRSRCLVRPMSHRRLSGAGRSGARYEWLSLGRWNALEASARGTPEPASLDRHAAFISERSWLHARGRGGATIESRIAHPEWHFWTADESVLDCGVADAFGPTFSAPLSARPFSAFVFTGSATQTSWPRRCG